MSDLRAASDAYPYNDLDELPAIEPEQITRDSIWVTRDKKRVAIKDMDDHHLLSAIRVLRGISPIGTTFSTTDERRRRWINAMANEAYLRKLEIDPLSDAEMLANAGHE